MGKSNVKKFGGTNHSGIADAGIDVASLSAELLIWILNE